MSFQKIRSSYREPTEVSRPTLTADQRWAVFRSLRDAREVFGLRAAHLATLQAMISCLQDGQGVTVFASNRELCRRVGGIDERTLRRHINRLIELGFVIRKDSPNKKRYRVRSDEARLSFGFSLEPLFSRADELEAVATAQEAARRECRLLHKLILTHLAQLDANNHDTTYTTMVRKSLRRKLTLPQYRVLLTEIEERLTQLSTAVDMAETEDLTGNNGQNVRHHSKTQEEEKKEKETPQKSLPPTNQVTQVLTEALSFANTPISSWAQIETLASKLAPMMGISERTYRRACQESGAKRASLALMIILQLGSKVRNHCAYFCSITLGKRRHNFDPLQCLTRLQSAT